MSSRGLAHCDRCFATWTLSAMPHGVGGFYRLPRSQPVPVLARWAWCLNCQAVIAAERILNEAEIRRELANCGWLSANWGDGIWRATRVFECGRVRDRMDHRDALLALRYWRKRRSGPPRCLTCSETRLIFAHDGSAANLDDFTLNHPGCGGTIRPHDDEAASDHFPSLPAYNKEGMRYGIYRRVECGWRYHRREVTLIPLFAGELSGDDDEVADKDAKDWDEDFKRGEWPNFALLFAGLGATFVTAHLFCLGFVAVFPGSISGSDYIGYLAYSIPSAGLACFVTLFAFAILRDARCALWGIAAALVTSLGVCIQAMRSLGG